MQCEESGFSRVRNGQTTVATSGTELPLLGVTYSAGTIKATVGGYIFTGIGTAFSATNTPPGFCLLTAGGNRYTIVKHESATVLRVRETIVTEAGIGTGVAYQVYELPHTQEVHISGLTGNIGALVWAGIRGSADITASAFSMAKGLDLILPVDLKTVDLWVDVTTNGDKLAWALLS